MSEAFDKLKAAVSGDPFRLCDCGAIPDWDGMGDYHWVSCKMCGDMTDSYLDPPDAKAEWNSTHNATKGC